MAKLLDQFLAKRTVHTAFVVTFSSYSQNGAHIASLLLRFSEKQIMANSEGAFWYSASDSGVYEESRWRMKRCLLCISLRVLRRSNGPSANRFHDTFLDAFLLCGRPPTSKQKLFQPLKFFWGSWSDEKDIDGCSVGLSVRTPPCCSRK